jgi:hypothetical protein
VKQGKLGRDFLPPGWRFQRIPSPAVTKPPRTTAEERQFGWLNENVQAQIAQASHEYGYICPGCRQVHFTMDLLTSHLRGQPQCQDMSTWNEENTELRRSFNSNRLPPPEGWARTSRDRGCSQAMARLSPIITDTLNNEDIFGVAEEEGLKPARSMGWNDNDMNPSPDGNIWGDHICCYCQALYNTAVDLGIHQPLCWLKMNASGMYSCRRCSYTCRTDYLLRKHNRLCIGDHTLYFDGPDPQSVVPDARQGLPVP